MKPRTIGSLGVALLAIATVTLLPSRALAPPLCSYQEKVGAEVLKLRVSFATVDGVEVSRPAKDYSLQSGCALEALSGALFDPDAPTSPRMDTWGLRTP